MKKPVLFIIFNRPETTKQVFDAIRKYKPTRLFIAADGPRNNKVGEKERCEKARKITENVDWPCKVKRLYRNTNLGCKNAVSGAVTWFFKNVDEGIILEDDCLPDQTFFDYCNILLKRYRNDTNIMHISGSSFCPKYVKNESYYFSQYPLVWGWATWKRAWKFYNKKINVSFNKDWPLFRKYNMSFIQKVYWIMNFVNVSNCSIDTWDYQWVYAIWRQKGCSITPNNNLVKNIGFSDDATHTKNASKNIVNVSLDHIKFPLKHPEFKINNNYDQELSKNGFIIDIPHILYLFLNNIINFKRC